MSSSKAEHVTELVVQAASRAGVRVILLTGGGGLKEVANSDNLYCLSEVPHEWLFNKVAAVVHLKPIPHSRLSIENLSVALKTAINDQVMRKAAADLGSLLRAEDGVTEAVKQFDLLADRVSRQIL